MATNINSYVKQLLIAVLFLFSAGSAVAQIGVASNFEVNAPLPTEVRDTMQSVGDTLRYNNANVVVPGLVTFVINENWYWYRDNFGWKEWPKGGGVGTDDQTAAEVAYTNNGQNNVQGGLDSLFSLTQKVIGPQVYGDSIFQFSKLVEISPYTELRNEFGGVAMNPFTGRIVVTYMYSSGHTHVPGTEITVAQYSDDMGQTWSDTIHVFDQPAAADHSIGGGATIMWDFVERRFIAQARNRQTGEPGYITWADSWDGVNWTNQRDFNPTTFGGEGFSFLASVTPPVRLKSDSSLLMTAYFAQPSTLDTAFVAVWKQPLNGSFDSGTLIHRGDANVISWATESQIREKKDGTLVVFIRGRDNDLTGSNFTWMSYESTDQGATWTNLQDRKPPDYNSTKPSWEFFGKNDDYIFSMYRSAADGSKGLYAYSTTGLIGGWVYDTLPQYYVSDNDTIRRTGFFLPGDIHKINDELALIQYTATDTVGVLQVPGLKVRSFFQVLTFRNPTPGDGVGVDGSGTVNTIPIFSDASTVTDSRISQTAERVNITIPDDDSGAGLYVENSDGGFIFSNGTGASGSFAPSITFTAKNRRPSLWMFEDDTDGGAFPLVDLRSSISGGSVSSRNLVAISNNTTQLFRFGSNGQLSINTPSTAHNRQLEVLSTNPQMRLTHTYDTHYLDVQVDNSGNALFNPTGNLVNINAALESDDSLKIGKLVSVEANSILGRTIGGWVTSTTIESPLQLSADGLGFTAQSANTFLAGPSGAGSTDPTFRAIVEADLPTRSASDVTATDAGNYFTGTDMEAITQELGADLYDQANLRSLLGIQRGAVSSTTDASGQISVGHGLSSTPTAVIVTSTTNDSWIAVVVAKNSTQFTVKFFDETGAAVASTSAGFDWIAIE